MLATRRVTVFGLDMCNQTVRELICVRSIERRLTARTAQRKIRHVLSLRYRLNGDVSKRPDLPQVGWRCLVTALRLRDARSVTREDLGAVTAANGIASPAFSVDGGLPEDRYVLERADTSDWRV